MRRLFVKLTTVCLLSFASLSLSCQQATPKKNLSDVRPRAFYQVPSDRLAYRLETDIDYNPPPAEIEKDEAIQKDFDIKRPNDALIRTITSPDGLRVLALYATSDTPEGDFRIDVYSADGAISRPILPANLTATFPQSVVWSPDGQQIAFIGYQTGNVGETVGADKKAGKKSNAKETPPDLSNDQLQNPNATPAPLIPPVAAYRTEQIYICSREGIDLKPLTSREGLIYFSLAWSPQSVALTALASKEDEWNARRNENLAPAGRPRLITLDGGERLLDDRATDVTPVWSPDGAKVATAFDTEVAIYDAGATALANAPTAAVADLRDELLASSVKYDETKLKKPDQKAEEKTDKSAKNMAKSKSADNASANNQNAKNDNANNASSSGAPLSFNPIVRLDWKKPDVILIETVFVRVYRGDQVVTNYLRWHALYLSPQPSVLKL